MQQRRRWWGWSHLLLLLLLSGLNGQQLLAAAQDAAASPSPAPAGTGGAAAAPPSPSPAATDNSNPATATPSPPPPAPSPEGSTPSPAVAQPPAAGATSPPPASPTGATGATNPAPPNAPPANTGSNSSDNADGSADDSSSAAPPPVPSTAVPPPSGGSIATPPQPTVGTPPATPPANGSTPSAGSTPSVGSTAPTGGVTPTPPSTTPTSGGSVTAPVHQPPAAATPEPAKNVSLPGYVLPTPDETAIDGISPNDDDCKLTSALYAAMGASNSNNCGSGSSSSSSSSSSGIGKTSLQDVQSSSAQQISTQQPSSDSSARFRDGLYTNKNGASFCVSTAGAAEMARSSARSAQFQSMDDMRELPDIEDPACEDQYATEREGCPPRSSRDGPMFFAETAGDGSTSPSPDSSAELSSSLISGSSIEPDELSNCSRKFIRAGTQPRSVAVVLLKWRREYYKSKEECCKEKGNIPGCDCNWAGHSYDDLPSPKMYSRLFTDECDKGPSLNRAFYDMTGGRITFHSKLRVPVPSGVSLSGNTRTEDVGKSPSLSSSSSSESSMVPIETPKSYLDPGGVDVYGWATLDAMRTEDGNCKDWCSEAIQQLGVDDTQYNHIVCLQHLGSPALCETCKDNCRNTCPAETGITTGCGCATCYYAWGGQASCAQPAPPGVKTGLGAWMVTYTGELAEKAEGGFVQMDQGAKVFLGHEIGHNMGLTHAGSLVCPFTEDGVINREPTACKPSWYGDSTSFMGSGQTLQLPAAVSYQVSWLPRNTLRLHPPGSERRWMLRPITIRRPSWQTGTRVRWFGNATSNAADALAIRIPLVNPADGRATIGGYMCPCNPMPEGNMASLGVCPACAEVTEKAGDDLCKDGPCCTDPKCADGGLTSYFVELHMPFRNNYGSTRRGVVIRMMGELSSSTCTSTRQVPTHVEGGQLRYLLEQADPSGETLGSKFVDTFRGVTVVLERWTNTSAVVRITA